MNAKEPIVLNNIFTMGELKEIKDSVKDYKSFYFEKSFSRYIISDMSNSVIKKYSYKILDLAKKTFSSNTLLPTYSLFAHYEGINPPPSLRKHRDDNACTYTIDLCLYQTEPWDLWVDNKSYTLQENEALAYYGNDQLHWRDRFPNPGKQHVAMIFFHFAEPDHWWFTKGPSYLSVIRNEMTEEDWHEQNFGKRS